MNKCAFCGQPTSGGYLNIVGGFTYFCGACPVTDAGTDEIAEGGLANVDTSDTIRSVGLILCLGENMKRQLLHVVMAFGLLSVVVVVGASPSQAASETKWSVSIRYMLQCANNCSGDVPAIKTACELGAGDAPHSKGDVVKVSVDGRTVGLGRLSTVKAFDVDGYKVCEWSGNIPVKKNSGEFFEVAIEGADPIDLSRTELKKTRWKIQYDYM